MERAGTLINKLKEQFEQHADVHTLAITAKLLLAELQQNNEQLSKGKVSVLLPPFATAVQQAETKIPDVEKQTAVVSVNQHGKIQMEEPNAWLFEAPVEIPTMVLQEQKEVFELNEVMMVLNESMNERLKEEKVEVATVLQGAPVRDLKKAIGVNDRYLFVNDLFRGDEDMYERSMKTINAFTIYPEAQYWIQRELKVKMSWAENSDTVKLFDQLVKRRFS